MAIIYLPLVVFFIVLYHFISPYYEGPKKRSWLLTAIASTFLSTCAIPYTIIYIYSGATVSSLYGSQMIAKVFQAYLTADLIMGSRHYPEYVSIVLGWIHHLAYISIVEFCIRANYTHILAVALLMELPTALLAWGSLHPTKLRNTVAFAVAFFSTRILFHAILIGLYTLPQGAGRKAVGGSWAPATLFISAFPMHCVWFTGCIKGFIRRAKARKEAAAKAAAEAVASQVDSTEPTTPSSTAPPVSPTMTSANISRFAATRSRTITALRRRIPPHQLQAMKQHVRALARYLEETARRTSPTREDIYDFVREKSRPIRKAIAVY